MPSHTSPKIQNAKRCYRVVTVSRGRERTIVSQHDSFQAAEQARKQIPSVDGVEIRIESTADSTAG